MPELDDDVTEEQMDAYEKIYDVLNKVTCHMLATMSYELQKIFKNLGVYGINYQLMKMF